MGWLWGAYAVPINRPWGGLGVALGGFVQPSFRFQLSAFSISAFAQLWLWGGLPAQSRITNHESPPALVGSARPFDVGSWMLDVQCSVFTIMNPSPGPDALPLPIYEPIFIINCYGQSLWQALFSPYDGFYYAQYEAHYLLAHACCSSQ